MTKELQTEPIKPADSLSVIFMGSPAFSVPSLQRLADRYSVKAVYTQPPRKSGRGMKLRQTDVGAAAEKMGLPCFWPETLKDPAICEELAAHEADIFVVVAYGLLLPQAILDLPRFGCVNGHASLLPRWRGAAPIQRAIEAGDRKTGVCTMLMEKGLDTGPVFDRCETDIPANITAGQLHDRLCLMTADLLCTTLDKIAAGTAMTTPQAADGVVYAPKISTEEARLDLTLTAGQLQGKINAFNPSPGAFIETGLGRLKLLSGQSVAEAHSVLPSGCFLPGYFLGLSASGGLILSCGGQTALEINRLQPAGKQAMAARDWLNGVQLSPGQPLITPPEAGLA